MKERRSNVRVRLRVLAACLGIFAADASRAQDVDLIVNGGFDEDLAGWNAFASGTSSASWDALDVAESSTSGSFRAEMVYLGIGNPNRVSAPSSVRSFFHSRPAEGAL